MSKGQLLRRPSMAVATFLLIAILLTIVVVPLLPAYDPYSQSLAARVLPPLSTSEARFHLLGTDSLGRDLLSRLALAGRISLYIGVAAASVSMVIGTLLGLVAGFFGGRVESAIMGLADLQLSIPRVLLLIAVVAVVGAEVGTLIILLGVTSWVAYGRVARAMTLSLREREFVLAATAIGASATWNLRKHVLPNIASQMIIIGSFELGQMIMLEASLSYLGLGVQPPIPSWGLMINEGQNYMRPAWWLPVLPGLAIFMLVAGVQFLTQLFTSESQSDVQASTAAGA